MAVDLFATAVAYVLVNEGGSRFTNAAMDHGGPTKFGITLNTLSAYRGTICTAVDVQMLQEDEAQAIYRIRYWQAMGLDAARSQVIATAALDGSVLCGVPTAAKVLQRVLGVDADGVMGPISQAALAQADPSATVSGFELGLRAYLKAVVAHDPPQKVWLTGWLCRLSKMATLTVATSTA